MSNSPFSRLQAGSIVAIFAVLLIAGYTLYAGLPYLLGPSLSATVTTQDGTTVISGKTARVSFLSIDNSPVPLQEDGTFSEILSFPPGYTAVMISAKDRFGRNLRKTITFVTK